MIKSFPFPKFLSFLALSFFLLSPAFAQGFDHSALDRFLKQYVDTQGRVDFAAAKKNQVDLDQYLEQIRTTDLIALAAGPKPEHLAFWMNVYHAGLLKLILENDPLESTQKIPGFWERKFLKVGANLKGESALYGLSQIRNEVLVPQFQDEKIHFALALGAKDGPPFPQEAFTGSRVLGQLFKQTRIEMGRPEMIQVDRAAKRIKLSRIFEWYAKDFSKNFGRPRRRGRLGHSDTAIVNFLIRYSKNLEQIYFLKAAQFKLEYSLFDWTLNDSSTAQ